MATTTKSSFATLPSELHHTVSCMYRQSQKEYCKGILTRRIHLAADGTEQASPWIEYSARLTGPVLSLWLPDAEVPQYLNLSDAQLVPVTPLQDHPHCFALNTAGKNLFLFSCPTQDALHLWTAAVTLCIFERAVLQEAYTVALITRWRLLHSVQLILFQPAQNKKFQAWVRARLSPDTEWRRLFLVLNGPPDTKHQKHPQAALFYSSKKKKSVVAQLTNCYAAYAVYPERPPLVELSSMIKVEGTIANSPGFALVMPDTSSSKTYSDPTKPFISMLTLFSAFCDTFCLYGRPKRLNIDRLDPNSMVYALDSTNSSDLYINVSDIIHATDGLSGAEARTKLKSIAGSRCNKHALRPVASVTLPPKLDLPPSSSPRLRSQSENGLLVRSTATPKQDDDATWEPDDDNLFAPQNSSERDLHNIPPTSPSSSLPNSDRPVTAATDTSLNVHLDDTENNPKDFDSQVSAAALHPPIFARPRPKGSRPMSELPLYRPQHPQSHSPKSASTSNLFEVAKTPDRPPRRTSRSFSFGNYLVEQDQLKGPNRRSMLWQPPTSSPPQPTPSTTKFEPTQQTPPRHVQNEIAARARPTSTVYSRDPAIIESICKEAANSPRGLLAKDRRLTARELQFVARETGKPFVELRNEPESRKSGLVGLLTQRDQDISNFTQNGHSVAVQRAIDLEREKLTQERKVNRRPRAPLMSFIPPPASPNTLPSPQVQVCAPVPRYSTSPPFSNYFLASPSAGTPRKLSPQSMYSPPNTTLTVVTIIISNFVLFL